MRYTYIVYGLSMSLPFSCPVLMPAPPETEPDVTVSYGLVQRELPNPAASSEDWTLGYTWQASPGCFVLRGGRRAGRFLVEGGTRVTIEPNAAAEEERLIYHLLHSVLAAVLQQRGLLVLHANAVVASNGAAVAIAGQSGAGKSTTLAALLRRGCAMLSDDITVLRRGSGRCIEVVPGIPHLHLCEDAAVNLDLDINGLPRNPLRRGKTVVPAPDGLSAAPAPLRALYILRPHRGTLRIAPISGAAKFAALQGCVYGPLLPREHTGIFPLFTAMAEQAAVYYIERPESGWTVPAITEVILNE